MQTIGLDLDGVLYQWHQSVYDFHKLYKGYIGTYTEFWTTEHLKFTKDFWDYITGIDIFYSDRFPDQDCLSFIEKIKDKFEIYYITARPEYVRLTTEQYLKRYKFPFLDNLIFTSDKINMARKYQFAYALDDNAKQVEELSKVTTAILIARPWNKDFWDTFPTAHTLMESIKFIEGVD